MEHINAAGITTGLEIIVNTPQWELMLDDWRHEGVNVSSWLLVK